jgi:hypothetical protein
MNTNGDMKWYIDERISQAYKDADNWRLAQEATNTHTEKTMNPLRVLWVRTIKSLLKPVQTTRQVPIASSLSPVTEK